MESQGWIKDYRKEMDSDIWVMPPLYLKVWQYLKYMVNHQSKEVPMSDGSKEKVDIGQHLTSLRGIARGVAYYENGKYKEPNPKTIKKIIDWLDKNKMITINSGKGNRQYTKITIVNYRVYQSYESQEVTVKAQQSNSKETHSTQQSNSEETVEKQFVDINKNEKNEKNDKNDKNDKEGEERKEVYKTQLLSFPTPIHEVIFNQFSITTYQMWFEDSIIETTGELITITVKELFKKEIIQDRFLDAIKILTGKSITVKVSE